MTDQGSRKIKGVEGVYEDKHCGCVIETHEIYIASTLGKEVAGARVLRAI